MRLIKWANLEEASAKHPDAEQPLADWVGMVRAARWKTPDELVRTANVPARTIKNKRVIFKIKGNAYRLICAVRYASGHSRDDGIVMFKFFGTHAEYDKIDPATVEP